jgi:hypothetical protein
MGWCGLEIDSLFRVKIGLTSYLILVQQRPKVIALGRKAFSRTAEASTSQPKKYQTAKSSHTQLMKFSKFVCQ